MICSKISTARQITSFVLWPFTDLKTEILKGCPSIVQDVTRQFCTTSSIEVCQLVVRHLAWKVPDWRQTRTAYSNNEKCKTNDVSQATDPRSMSRHPPCRVPRDKGRIRIMNPNVTGNQKNTSELGQRMEIRHTQPWYVVLLVTRQNRQSVRCWRANI